MRSPTQSFADDHNYAAWKNESGGKPPPWWQDYTALRETCSAAAAALPKAPMENFGIIESGESWDYVLGWDDWWDDVDVGSRV